jgi:uncharacterized glyoxalase superfamily protein PhnB
VVVSVDVPTGVDGSADLVMLRMAPQWFPRHIARQEAGLDRPDVGRLNLALRSPAPVATARWLARAFGLEPTADLPATEAESGMAWIELRAGAGFIVLWADSEATTDSPDSPFVYVDDVDAHAERAAAAGATIIEPVGENGFRAYIAADCDGRRWVFAQAGPRTGR